MMDKDDQQLSPEEKLLKVIQGGPADSVAGTKVKPPKLGVRPASAPNESAAKAGAATVEAPMPVVSASATNASADNEPLAVPRRTAGPGTETGAGKKELKLAGRKKDGPRKQGAAREKVVTVPAVGGGGSKPRRAGPKDLGMRTVNNVLAMVAAVVLLFAIFDIGMNVRATPRAVEIQAPPGTAAVPDAAGVGALPDLNAMLADWDNMKLFKQKDERPKPRPTPGREPVKDLVIKGQSEAKDGGMEAIFKNSRTSEMHFLRVGQTLKLNDKEYTLKQVEQGRAIFTDGVRDIYVP